MINLLTILFRFVYMWKSMRIVGEDEMNHHQKNEKSHVYDSELR